MITIKTPEEIEIMAEGGHRLAEVLRTIEKETRVGVTTRHLDHMAYQMINKLGAKPAFLNYRPAGSRHAYPYTLCTSINDVVVHGQPSDYAIRPGDLVKLDLGLIYKGFYLDSAVTVFAEPFGGEISSETKAVAREARKLIDTTRAALAAGIIEARISNTIGDIGNAIEGIVRKNKFSVAEGLIGHGIGRELHEDPAVFNFGKRGTGEPLEEGMVIAIEPMVAAGRGATVTGKDESFVTRDGSVAAHFEHTVAITARGSRILTE